MVLTADKIYAAEQMDVYILSSDINYQSDRFLAERIVPYSTYGDRAAPVTVMAEGGIPAIDTQNVSTIISLKGNHSYTSSAIVTNANPDEIEQMRDIAKVMVASALTLGQARPLQIKGQNPAFVLEVIKVCIASRIAHTYSDQHGALANQRLGKFCFSAEEQVLYTVANWPSENYQPAIGNLMIQGSSERELAATLDPFLTSFGSYTNPSTPPRAITQRPSEEPKTPENVNMSFF